ncbi:hypothetical protein GY45DRAFT_898019 [Cubamyces sp. BRFM 1775]|nr:hypothetical protein GY45DRAFT_898019 [Cubamyces sp. BRFM 1775]
MLQPGATRDSQPVRWCIMVGMVETSAFLNLTFTFMLVVRQRPGSVCMLDVGRLPRDALLTLAATDSPRRRYPPPRRQLRLAASSIFAVELVSPHNFWPLLPSS